MIIKKILIPDGVIHDFYMYVRHINDCFRFYNFAPDRKKKILFSLTTRCIFIAVVQRIKRLMAIVAHSLS